jgi:diguanylate cyclase (GGDEF)-like protein/PAS domain S-box-containing protein
LPRLLAIGPEEYVRKRLGFFLRGQSGFSIHQAETPEEAIALAERVEMDVLLASADSMDGVAPQVLERVREHSAGIQLILLGEDPVDENALEILPDHLPESAVEYAVRGALRLRQASLESLRLREANEHWKQHLEDLVERRTQALTHSRDRLEKARMQQQAMLRSIPHGLCMLSREWRIEYANHALLALLEPAASAATQELVGNSFRMMFETEEDFQHYAKSAIAHIRRHGLDVSDVELRRTDGSSFWCEISIVKHDPSSTVGGFVATLTDITEKRRAREELLKAAFFDPLTGLPNRKLFLDRLEECLETAAADPNFRFAVLFLDLDRFKTVNDSLGHLSGDRLLHQVAERLQSLSEKDQGVFRLGGDEFTVLLDGLQSEAEAVRVAEHLLRELNVPFRLHGMDIYIDASIGIAMNDARYSDSEEILRDADTALYKAKERGRSRCAVFDSAMHDEARQNLDLENSLRTALEKQEFFLEYQPVVRLIDNVPVGYEALIRWNHPERGVLQPQAFIEVAEETGRIVAMGNWVLNEACCQMAAWNALLAPGESPRTIAVNVSARQFTHPRFVQSVADALEQSGLAPECLTLEITETVILDGPDLVQRIFGELKQLGIKLHLDDFGMGYSSLSYLQRFPVDALKVDRMFLKDVASSPKARQLVTAILSMAEALSLSVVVEGVEDEDILEVMRGMPCTLVQGYFFYYPLSAEDAERLIAGERL